MANSIDKIIAPAIEACENISPGAVIGGAILAIVLVDPTGFRDRVFGTIDKVVDARYSIVIDGERKVVEVRPGSSA